MCKLGIPTPAAQSVKTEYPPFRGARQCRLDRCSRNLGLVSFGCDRENFPVFGRIKAAAWNRPLTSQTLGMSGYGAKRFGRAVRHWLSLRDSDTGCSGQKDGGPDSKAQREAAFFGFPRRQASSFVGKPARHRFERGLRQRPRTVIIRESGSLSGYFRQGIFVSPFV